MAHHCRYAFALSLVFAIGGCIPQPTISIPSATVSSATSTPDSKALDTDTPQPINTSTIAPIPSATLTSPLDLALVSGWFPIPNSAQTIDFSTAQAFKGLRIPPLSDELVIEVYAIQPYGEVPPETIFYQLYLIRKGTARMLWLGIPFKGKEGCCGQETPSRIYDSIPFPPIETSSLFIPFVCMRNQEPDLFLIVVAEPPKNGVSATNIHYAWRIDQATTSLQPVSTQGIEC